MTEIRNAVIQSTQLGPEDHGIFTAYLMLQGDGWGIGFGGYGLDIYDEHVAPAYGSYFIMEVLWVLEVRCWEKLPGTPVRVEIEGGWGGKALRIGHYFKDQWFDPRDYPGRKA